MTKKNILIIGASIVFMAVVVIGWYFFGPKLKNSTSPVNSNQANATSTNGTGENFDPAASLTNDCQAYTNDPVLADRCMSSFGPEIFNPIFINEAISSGDADQCAKILSITSRDSCFSGVAANRKNQDICQQISSQDQQTLCRIGVMVALNDFEQCSKLTAEDLIKRCQESVVSRNNSSEFCQRLKNAGSQEKCLELYYTRKAILREDYSLCAKITIAGGKQRCLAQLPADTDGDGLSDEFEKYRLHTDAGKADTDGDGLSDYDEAIIYLTNPLNSDTDGDGVSDGTEVAENHDPLQP